MGHLKAKSITPVTENLKLMQTVKAKQKNSVQGQSTKNKKIEISRKIEKSILGL